MDPKWSIQKDFQTEIRDAIDSVKGVYVDLPNVNDGVIEITVFETTRKHRLVKVRIPVDDIPEVKGFGRISNPVNKDETNPYVPMARGEYNFYTKRFEPLRNEVIDAVTRAIDRVRRDIARKAVPNAQTTSGGITIVNSPVNVGGNMIGGNEIVHGDKLSGSKGASEMYIIEPPPYKIDDGME